jgi:hypothetical protein
MQLITGYSSNRRESDASHSLLLFQTESKNTSRKLCEIHVNLLRVCSTNMWKRRCAGHSATDLTVGQGPAYHSEGKTWLHVIVSFVSQVPPVHAIITNMWSIAPLIPNIGEWQTSSPATLPPGRKSGTYCIWGWVAPEPVWTFRRRKKSFVPDGIRTPCQPSLASKKPLSSLNRVNKLLATGLCPQQLIQSEPFFKIKLSTCRAQLRCLSACLSMRMPEFSPRQVHIGFVKAKGHFEKFSPSTYIYSCRFHSTSISIFRYMYLRL